MVSSGRVMAQAQAFQSPPALRALAAVTKADFAYQPIVGISSLRVHGFEALARLPDSCGFINVCSALDAAFDAGDLRVAEQRLIAAAISKFAGFADAARTRLFCNLDNRVFDDAAVNPAGLASIIARVGLHASNICIELSERTPPGSLEAFSRLVDMFVRQNVRIAIDDFGQGFSGLDTLMRVEPHYVKVDRAFIDGIAASPKKQAIVSKLTGLAHSLGFLIVAEGVETEDDFRTVRDLGCDLAQGYLIARPTTDIGALRMVYDHVASRSQQQFGIDDRLARLITAIEPLEASMPLSRAVACFERMPQLRLIPVIDCEGYVQGAIYEEDVRRFLVSDFGRSLLVNKGIVTAVSILARRCPICEVTSPIDAIVNSYVVADSTDGLVLTHEGHYAGMLTNNGVLRLAAEREVAAARDQNPLTCLPGNISIGQHVTEVLAGDSEHTLAFFDFDHFKAFNDHYGFMAGDRALLIFTDLLMKMQRVHGAYAGHIGGDDFFLSMSCDIATGETLVRELTERFARDAESLYSADDRVRGGFHAVDRFGEMRFFPLLRVSAALLPLPASRSHLTQDAVITALSAGKAAAKRSSDGLVRIELPPTAVHEQVAQLQRAVG